MTVQRLWRVWCKDGNIFDRRTKQLEIDWNLHQHGPGDAAHGSVIGLKNDAHNFAVLLHLPGALHDAIDEPLLVNAVELETERNVGARAAGDHQQGNAVEIALANPAHGMRNAGSRHDDQATDFSGGGAADGIGGKCAATLMRGENGAYLLGATQLVVNLGGVDAGNTKSV